jgi:antitoxin component YwqK of YwqJK toxin-antitoxin module
MNRLSSISAILGAALLILLVASASAYAENKPDPRLGTYSGTFGGDRVTLEVREGFKAIITFGDSEAAGVRWVPQRIANKVFVMVMMDSVKLLYALTKEGLELRAPANPETVIKMKNGKPMSILRRVEEGDLPQSEEDAAGEEASPTVAGDWAEVGIRGNTSLDLHDNKLINGNDGLPPCPLGTQRQHKETKLLGVEAMAVICDGPGTRAGPFAFLSRSGVKLVEGQFENGEKAGRWVFRNQRGFKTMDGTYENGESEGLWLKWGKDGTFSHQELHRKGKVIQTGQPLVDMKPTLEVQQFKCPEGTTETTTKSERLLRKYCATELGQRHGPVIGWLPTGQLVFMSRFVNGKREGTFAVWYPFGQLKIREDYHEGELHGTVREWYECGMLKFKAEYENGQRQNFWVYDTFGNKASEAEIEALEATLAAGHQTTIRIDGEHSTDAYAMLDDLAPIRQMLFEYVSLSVLLKKAPKARKSIDMAGHEADRRTACSGLATAERKYGKPVFLTALDAFCSMQFDPNRDPMMPDSPVKLGCTTTNAGGNVHEEGRCIEITPEMCGKVVRKMCRGNK